MLAVLHFYATNAVNPIAKAIVIIWYLFIYGRTADHQLVKSTWLDTLHIPILI